MRADRVFGTHRVAAAGAFVRANRSLCERLVGHLPHTRDNIFDLYSATVAGYMRGGPFPNVTVDIGQGGVCPYTAMRPLGRDVMIVAVDISEPALARNTDADQALVADASRRLPLRTGRVDIMTSRSVLEHLPDLEAFVEESARILRPGGHSIHLFTGRYAWFSLLNRALGPRLSRSLLYRLHAESKEAGGFPVVHDHCYASAVRWIAERHGYEVVSMRPNYGTSYTYFFVPLFLLTSLYEIVIRALGLRDLAASFLVVMCKRG